GIEAMLVARDNVTVVPEQGNEVVQVSGGTAISEPLHGAASRISDAAQLPGGTMLVLLRGVGLSGFRNALGVLAKDRAGWKIRSTVPLNVGTFANLEGMAVQRLPDGETRLWLVTDDNFQP